MTRGGGHTTRLPYIKHTFCHFSGGGGEPSLRGGTCPPSGYATGLDFYDVRSLISFTNF